MVSAAPVALDAVMLTTAAMNAHNALGGRLASSILGSSRAMPGAVSDSTGGIMKQLEGARREDDDGSSVLSSVPSSDLSDLSSEDGDSPRKPVKRRRKNMLTPPTSVDEPNSKRANGRKLIREGPTEYDVEDRKEYFEAGLYSGATNNLGKNAGRAKMQRRITAKGAVRLSRPLEEVVENFKFGLPLFHGLTLLQQERDFRLPWDIRNDFDLSCLPETAEGLTFRSDAWDRVGRQKKPAPYKQISQSMSYPKYDFVLTSPDTLLLDTFNRSLDLETEGRSRSSGYLRLPCGRLR